VFATLLRNGYGLDLVRLDRAGRWSARRPLSAGLAVCLVVVLTSVGGFVPGLDASEVTPGLLEARAETQRLATEIDEAQSHLAGLETEIAQLQGKQDDLEAARSDLRAEVERLAVDRYMRGGVDPLFDPDPGRRLRAEAISDIVGSTDGDVLDQYRALSVELDANRRELDDRLADQESTLTSLQHQKEALDAQLARLEQLEIQRVVEERHRAEEEARRARDEAARKAAEERAAQLAAEEQARRAGEAAVDAPAAAPAATPEAPVVPPPSNGGMVCPVPGAVFRDGYGDPRPGGRVHQGIDMVAPSGTPILAPVAGTVVHGADPLGGNNFNLAGADGRGYYGAHLSAYGQSGQVAAGTVVGYVGETGDAVGAHLHIEIHVGGVPINPYPDLVAACG
jgi:murein DD-endopeptidase MepM/ murein hydrolase activator NlpD